MIVPVSASVSVSEAVTSRRSIRRFLPDPVDPAALRSVLETAQRAPSGGNVQPWNAHVLTGEHLAALIEGVSAVLQERPRGAGV